MKRRLPKTVLYFSVSPNRYVGIIEDGKNQKNSLCRKGVKPVPCG